MPSSPSSTIFILFLVAVGFLVGAVLATWLAKREKTRLPGERTLPSKPHDPGRLDPEYFEEVVSLWRRRADNSLMVVQDGKLVELASQVQEVKRKQWEQAAHEWLIWLGLLPARTTKPQFAPAETTPAPRIEPVQTSVSNPAARPPGKPEITPASELSKGSSIVLQVNDILQENLRASGLSQRGISLAEDPKKGVIVYVGLQRFEGIDSVTDLEARSLIKEAVKEWERRSEKGS